MGQPGRRQGRARRAGELPLEHRDGPGRRSGPAPLGRPARALRRLRHRHPGIRSGRHAGWSKRVGPDRHRAIVDVRRAGLAVGNGRARRRAVVHLRAAKHDRHRSHHREPDDQRPEHGRARPVRHRHQGIGARSSSNDDPRRRRPANDPTRRTRSLRDGRRGQRGDLPTRRQDRLHRLGLRLPRRPRRRCRGGHDQGPDPAGRGGRSARPGDGRPSSSDSSRPRSSSSAAAGSSRPAWRTPSRRTHRR